MLDSRAITLLLASVPLVGCGPSEPRGPACAELSWGGPRARTGLILVVGDTVRRDRIGVYGGVARTPAFDAFAGENLLFTHASTQAPWTTPSIATLFTSLYPSQHGVLLRPEEAVGAGASRAVNTLADELVTLAEILHGAGYRTAAFVGNPWLQGRFGFAQGFDVYDDRFAAWDSPSDELTRAGLGWLDTLPPGEPFFLYLHYIGAHRPYVIGRWDVYERFDELQPGSTGTLSTAAAATIAEAVRLKEGMSAGEAGLTPTIPLLEAAYDRGIERFDVVLGDLLRRVDEHPLGASAAIIVTSDHGEALFHRGFGNHGNGLYDDELAIPLAVRLPGVTAAGERVECATGLIDLLPTLCTYLDVPCPSPAIGVSLLAPASDDRFARRHLVAEGVYERASHRAVRDDRYKLILQPEGGPEGKKRALFDLVEDAEERHDLLATGRGDAERIARALARAALDAVPASTRSGSPAATIDPALEQRLRALGYLD